MRAAAILADAGVAALPEQARAGYLALRARFGDREATAAEVAAVLGRVVGDAARTTATTLQGAGLLVLSRPAYPGPEDRALDEALRLVGVVLEPCAPVPALYRALTPDQRDGARVFAGAP